MLDTTRFYDAGPCGAGSLEYVDAGHLRPVPLVRTELGGIIAGPLADLSVEQVFHFTAGKCGHTIDALYHFPTPSNVALQQVVVRFGDVTIETELRPREENARILKMDVDGQYLNAGKHSPYPPPFAISNIPPGTDVHITVRYAQVGRPSGIGFSLDIPLVRHSRGIKGDPQTHSPPFQYPEHRFTMHVHSIGKGELSSPTFELQRDGDIYSLKTEAVVPDRDLELMWTPYQYGGRPLLQVFTDGTSEPCFLALVSPPKACGEGLPREWTIMVDGSVSMNGPKRQAADRAAERLLALLSPRDRFNLCLFHSKAAWFVDRPLRATADNVARAMSFLQGGKPGGLGFETALEQALGQRVTYGDISRHVIIITDAQVSNDGRILGMLQRESLKPARRRCSILCIDSVHSSYLAWRLAEVGGGSCRPLLPPSQEADGTTALDAVLDAWRHPVVADLQMLSSRRLTGLRSMYMGGTYRSEIGELRSGISTWIVDRCGAGRTVPRFSLPGCDGDAEMIVAEGVRALYGVRP